MIITTCPLCRSPLRTVADRIAGYRDDLSFAIVECISCGLSCALPPVANPTLYQWIYDNIERVPGYARYHAYFNQVKQVARPLEYLTSRESAYWACAKYLQSVRSRLSREPRILEVGCGAGYFTYALRKAGYNVTGCDISASAISKAIGAFGSFYKVIDIESTDLPASERYDVVLMMEIIEHVANPVQFLNAARQLLTPDGESFLTTPNKDAFTGFSGWDTDLPPVHLYWFTACSIEALAARVGCEVHFSNFSDYFKDRYLPKAQLHGASKAPTFSADGTLIAAPLVQSPEKGRVSRWGRRLADAAGISASYRRIRDQITGRERWCGSQGPTLAAWLKPRPIA